MKCQEFAPNAWICRTPMRELSREPIGDLWCFKCRRRAPHDTVVRTTVEPSYYDPDWSRECSRCHEDHTLFPGWEYVEVDA